LKELAEIAYGLPCDSHMDGIRKGGVMFSMLQAGFTTNRFRQTVDRNGLSERIILRKERS